MSSGLLIRLLLCIVCFGLLVFASIDHQNRITRLRLKIPQLVQQLRECEADNSQLTFQIAQFEHPAHLMELAAQPRFSHLKYPQQGDVVSLP